MLLQTGTQMIVMTLKKPGLDLCAITKAKISKLGRLIISNTMSVSGLCWCNKAVWSSRVSPKTVNVPESSKYSLDKSDQT